MEGFAFGLGGGVCVWVWVDRLILGRVEGTFDDARVGARDRWDCAQLSPPSQIRSIDGPHQPHARTEQRDTAVHRRVEKLVERLGACVG